MKLLLLTIFVVIGVEQLIVCLQGNTTVADNELPDSQTLWQIANFTGTRKTRKPKPSIKKQIKPKLFPNLSTILQAFQRAKMESVYRLEAINVMKGFDEDCMIDPEQIPFNSYEDKTPVLRKPYIAIEGDYIQQKKYFMNKLAKKIDAIVMRNPPTCLYAYRNLFPYTNSLRTAFFSLGEYAISYNITLEWTRHPVILTGSWADRTSYVVCKAFRLLELPPAEDEVYLWPKDLLRPDVLVFLHNYSHVRDIPTTSRHYYRVRVLEWYNKCQGPQVVMVNTTRYGTIEELVDNVILLVRETSGNHTDVSSLPIPDITRTYKTKRPRSSGPRRKTTAHAYSNVTLPMTTIAVTFGPSVTVPKPEANQTRIHAIDALTPRTTTAHVLNDVTLTAMTTAVTFGASVTVPKPEANQTRIHAIDAPTPRTTTAHVLNDVTLTAMTTAFTFGPSVTVPKRSPGQTYIHGIGAPTPRTNTAHTPYDVTLTTTTIEVTSGISVTTTNGTHCNSSDSGGLLSYQKYTHLQSLLDEFRHGNYSKTPIAELVLSHFYHQCLGLDQMPQFSKHRIFIAVESNSVSTRQILAARYAKHLGGDVYRVMPKCLQRIRKYFKPNHPLLDAFYLLGVYVATIHLYKSWGKDPVVITGSWIDKAANMIARRYNHDIPPPESSVYKLSAKDLTMPDIIFYAFFADDVHRTPETTRPPHAWKHRVTEIFRRMEGPPVFILDCKHGFESMVREMINHTLNTLNGTYDLRYLWPYWDQLRTPQLT